MALKTTAEMFAPLVAGKYTGSPRVLWQQLLSSWSADEVTDHTIGSQAAQRAGEGDLCDAIQSALDASDHARMLVLCDQAEEAGVSPELCDLTRRALRVQYPA